MNIFRNTKLSPDLQADLASYGLLRKTVKEESSKGGGKGAKLVGVLETSDEYKLFSVDSLQNTNVAGKDIVLSIVAPENEAFDMISPKDFSDKIKSRDEKSLRAFLLKLIDSVHI